MKIDYYISSLNRIYKKSIDTNNEAYISHNETFVVLKEGNLFGKEYEVSYFRQFEYAKKYALTRLESKINNLYLNLTNLKNSTKAFNE